MPPVLLQECHAKRAAIGLERTLELCRINRQPPGQDLRETAVLLAVAVPLTAAKLPLLLKAAGPQTAAVVKAEARRIAASRLDGHGAASASSVTAALSASEAARIAGVTSQAVRAAAAAGRLVARKNQITGAWQIARAALEEWMETRSAA